MGEFLFSRHNNAPSMIDSLHFTVFHEGSIPQQNTALFSEYSGCLYSSGFSHYTQKAIGYLPMVFSVCHCINRRTYSCPGMPYRFFASSKYAYNVYLDT